jgi:hypothetical protein
MEFAQIHSHSHLPQLGDLVRMFRDDMMTKILAPAHLDEERLANVRALTFLFELQPAVLVTDRIIMKLLDNGLEVCEAMISPLVSQVRLHRMVQSLNFVVFVVAVVVVIFPLKYFRLQVCLTFPT